jgi:hypothetical protein
VSALGASPVGLNYYSLVLPSVLLTARADVTSDFLAGVIYDTAKRLKEASSYPPYHDILVQNNIHYTTDSTFESTRWRTVHSELSMWQHENLDRYTSADSGYEAVSP